MKFVITLFSFIAYKAERELMPNDKPQWAMKTTPLVVFVLFIVAALYDLATVVFGGDHAVSTISAFMVRIGFAAPWATFTCGLICGHFFFNMLPTKEDK